MRRRFGPSRRSHGRRSRRHLRREDGGAIDGALSAPLRPDVPTLRPGATVPGRDRRPHAQGRPPVHQGTVDSNEIWVEVTATSGGRVIGRNGGDRRDGRVDPYAHFINVYMLDRKGDRIDRRNPQDIFMPLYNHQIPPSAAAVVHYGFDGASGHHGADHGRGQAAVPQVRRASSRRTRWAPMRARRCRSPRWPPTASRFPSHGAPPRRRRRRRRPLNTWERWNDYGIGLLLEGRPGARKASCGRPPTPSPSRTAGRSDGAAQSRPRLSSRKAGSTKPRARCGARPPPAPPWTVAWLSGLVNKENGYLDQAIEDFSACSRPVREVGARRFDFSDDYEVINELGQALFERAKLERGRGGEPGAGSSCERAAAQFERTLQLDPENVTAHYVLSLIYDQLGDARRAAEHAALHARYKPDDNARDRAIATHRLANAAANHAAQSIVIYPLR